MASSRKYQEFKDQEDRSSKLIPNCLQDKIANIASKHPLGIESQKVLDIFQKEYGIKINIEKLGFHSINSFLVNCSKIQIRIIKDEYTIFPKYLANQQVSLEETYAENALPCVKDMNCLWKGYFADDVCDPTYSYKKYPLNIKKKHMIVQVSDVHSPSLIWFQPLDNAADLATLMLKLNLFYDDKEELYVAHEDIIKPGLLCCVKFHVDNRWYRAQIIEMSSNDSVKVSYVDYGTISYQMFSGIRLLDKRFINQPIQSLKGKLFNVQPLDGDDSWSNDANFFLFETLYSHYYFAQIMDVKEEEPSIEVVLIDTSETTDLIINDLLVEKKFAICSEMFTTTLDKRKTPPASPSKIEEVTNDQLKLILHEKFFGKFLSEENARYLMFEAALADKVSLILINIEGIYVVREQYIKQFASGIATMLIEYKLKKFINQSENIIINHHKYGEIFSTLTEYDWAKGKTELILIRLKRASELLKIIAPAHKTSITLLKNFNRNLNEEIENMKITVCDEY